MWPFKKRPVYTLHIFADAANKWRFHAKAKNGEILFQSEAYTLSESAERAAEALIAARLVMA